MTSYKLQTTSYKLQVTSYKLQATSYKLQATSYKLQVTLHAVLTHSPDVIERGWMQHFGFILILVDSQVDF